MTEGQLAHVSELEIEPGANDVERHIAERSPPTRDLAVAVCRDRLLVRIDERGLDLMVDTPV